jgi:Zn-dependent M28 family amino/carboxypeptidase
MPASSSSPAISTAGTSAQARSTTRRAAASPPPPPTGSCRPGRPLRTIRVVWFGAEEVGLFGGYDYLRRHAGENHAVIAESDFGADRVWSFDSRLNPAARPVVDEIARLLFPLGITRGSVTEASGSDIGPLSASGVPTIQLNQDGTRYFDFHHTPDDTLDKIDPVQLRQNVAAWTAMLAVAAEAPGNFGPVEPRR